MDMLFGISSKPAAARTGRDGRGRRGLSLCQDKNAWRAVLADEPRPFAKAIFITMTYAIAPLTAALDKYGIELRRPSCTAESCAMSRSTAWVCTRDADWNGWRITPDALANVIAIGDSENDLTMLQMAGLGVAMANSEPCIREAADVITGSNTENGVAQAIHRHILGDER
ncbi:MAG: HAD hydrolase family protein [Butyricicoccus sp.]